MSTYKQLINKMTLEEKASLLSGKDFWNTRSIERLKVPKMAMADGPHGLRKQNSEGDHLGLVEGVKATCFPTSATMANSWDVDLCKEVGKALGREAAYNDVNILLGPGLNIKRNPLCGRNFEYFSEDPYVSGKMAAAYTKGIQSQGVGACLKHFVANNQEYLRMVNDSIIDDRTLHEIYLTGFEIAVKEGKPKAVMSAYNKVNGTYANENAHLLREILVDDWGFDGMVISDWGGSNDHVAGVKAGAHLEMPTTGNDSPLQLVKAVNEGLLEESIIDERVDEFLNVLYGTEIKGEKYVDYNDQHSLARRAAEASIVLLKNTDVLPLREKCQVAIIGDFAKNPRYQGAGSSLVNAYTLESTLDVIGNTPLNVVGYEQGYNRIGKNDKKKMADAVALARKAEVALLYIGLNEVDEVEGHDRSHMKLAKSQIDLVEAVSKVANKVVVIISGGSAIEMPWASCCDGIIHSYLSGEAGASAVLNVITGKVNPSGKLSESYPLTYEECPNVRYYPGREQTSEYREGMYVGYRYYDKRNMEVRYPFGYGLSYTTFDYSDLEVGTDAVSCTVTNTGSVSGSEVIQLYIGKEQDNHLYRVEKELKGFHKVYLDPQESIKVTIPFDDYSFRYYDVKTSQFQQQRGAYKIQIGSSSRDIRLVGTVDLEGVEVATSHLPQKYFDGNVDDVSQQEYQSLYGKELPRTRWDRSKPLGVNDSLSQMVYAKSFLARIVIKILLGMRNRSHKKGKPDLNLIFLSNMPFRAIGKMSGGGVTMEMVDDMLVVVNGKFFKGMKRLIKSYRSNRKRGKN